MIHVYATDGIHKAFELGTDTIENFEKVRNQTRACNSTILRGFFSIEGHEDHVFLAVID